MGLTTHLFYATPEALRLAFVGWGEVLPEPVFVAARAVVNPFTGQAQQAAAHLAWAPDRNRPAARSAPPPDLRAFDVLPLAGIDGSMLALLYTATVGFGDAAARHRCRRPALVPPNDSTSECLALPDLFVSAFLRERTERNEIAARWEALVLRNVAAIRNEFTRVDQTRRWTGTLPSVVEACADLTAQRRPGQQLYGYTTL